MYRGNGEDMVNVLAKFTNVKMLQKMPMFSPFALHISYLLAHLKKILMHITEKLNAQLFNKNFFFQT